MNGTLALVGSGEYLPPMEPVDRWLLGRVEGEPRVACLPTAAGTEGPERVAYWSRLGVEHFSRLGAQAEAVGVIDGASADDGAAVTDVLERGGVVAGCSAGAMIFGESIPTFPAIVPFRRAFSLLPGAVIMPHYDEMPGAFARMIRMLLGQKTLVGIEGNTALVRSDGAFKVVGAGGVTVWNRREKRRYTDGATVRWP